MNVQNRLINIAPLILISFICVAVYSNSVKNPFLNFDDSLIIVDNPYTKELSWDNIRHIFTSIIAYAYIPLYTLSYAIDYYFWGLNPAGYHIVNILLHTLNSILIYIIIKQFTGNKTIPLITSLLFAVHPVHVESVTWLSGRKDVLSMSFFLSSFFLFIRYYKEDSIRRQFYYIGSLFLFLLAMLSKATTIILPFLLVLYEECWGDKVRDNNTNKRVKYIPFLAIGGIITCMSTFIGYTENTIKGYYGNTFYPTMLTMFKVLIKYIQILFYPFNLSAHYEIVVSESMFEPSVIFSISLLILLFLAAVKYRNSKEITFCILWFFIALLPVSNIIPISIFMADRYLYIPSIGFYLLISISFVRIFKLDSIKTILPVKYDKPYKPLIHITGYLLLIFIVVSLSILTVKRNTIWASDISLWQDAVKKFPDSPLIHKRLGILFKKTGEYGKALDEFETSIRLNPDMISAANGMAVTYQLMGFEEKAISVYKKNLFIDTKNIQALNNLGNIYYKRGLYDKALLYYKKAKASGKGSSEDNAKMYFNIGSIYATQGNYSLAIREFSEGLRINPYDIRAHTKLGDIFRKTENYNKAISEYKEALRYDPDNKKANSMLKLMNSMR